MEIFRKLPLVSDILSSFWVFAAHTFRYECLEALCKTKLSDTKAKWGDEDDRWWTLSDRGACDTDLWNDCFRIRTANERERWGMVLDGAKAVK